MSARCHAHPLAVQSGGAKRIISMLRMPTRAHALSVQQALACHVCWAVSPPLASPVKIAILQIQTLPFQGGVWYQKCYDPECRSYRSEIMPLPPAIMQRLHTEGAAQAHNSGHPELQAQQQAVSDEGLYIKQPLTAIQQSDVLEVCNRSSPQHEAFWPRIGHRDGCEKENRDQTGEKRSRRDVYDFGTGVLGDFSEADQADGGFDRELLNLLTPSE